MYELTETEDRVFVGLCAHIATHKIPPSRQELADACGISREAADQALKRLQKKGRVKLTENIARGIKVL